MRIIKKLRDSINSNKLKLSLVISMALLVVLDSIDPNLIAEIHALHFNTNTFLQVKIAYLTIGILVIGTLTYLTTPKSI